MKIVCPTCATQFKLPKSVYKLGAKAKCAVCSAVFTLPDLATPESTPQTLAPNKKDDETNTTWTNFEDIDSAIDATRETQAQNTPPSEVEKMFSEVEEDTFASEEETSSAEYNTSSQAEAFTSKIDENNRFATPPSLALLKNIRPKHIGIAAITFLLIVYLAYQTLSGSQTANNPNVLLPQGAASEAQVKLLALEDIRQYFVTNEHVGQISVIEGSVVNNFPVTKDFIQVEGTFYDQAGVPLVSKKQLCGTSLSLFQLNTLTQAEIENALNNKLDVLSNNTSVPPNEKVNFMIVFFSPPSNEIAAEFGVRPVAAQDPPNRSSAAP